jgi:hypothetical protein
MSPDVKAVLLLIAVSASVSMCGLVGLAYGEEPAKNTLHQYLLSLPRHTTDEDETQPEREQRLLEKAEAIQSATDNAEERAWLTMTGTRESHWARYVDLDLDRCKGGHSGRCDRGRAWSVWQLHGTDRTGGAKAAAVKALETFRRGAKFCRSRGHDYWEGGTAMYARGDYCAWVEASSRVLQMRKVLGRIR